jgi:hypothetical protein
MIVVQLTMLDDGAITCTSNKTINEPLKHLDLVQLIGVLEMAKMSFLAGRWALLDKEGKTAIKLYPIDKDYKRKIPRTTSNRGDK